MEQKNCQVSIPRGIEDQPVEKRILQARVPVAIEVPEAMRPAIFEVMEGLYDAPYFGEGLTILDIGANVGAFTRWANLRWPHSRIYAYEPHPETFELLLRNTAGLANVTCVNNAVYPSQREREPFFSRYAGDGESGLAAVVSKIFANLPGELIFEVPVLHPDRLPPADILKLDTEGAEVSILSAMDLSPVSLILLQYHFGQDRDQLKRLLQADFLLEYEDNLEWGALMTHTEYRRDLAGDTYGQLCFVNQRLQKLSRYSANHLPQAQAPRSNGTGHTAHHPEISSPTVQAPAANGRVLPAARPALKRSVRSQPARKRSLTQLFDLLRTLVIRDMKLRYKRSVLGIAWSLFNPLAQLLVFGFVFRYVLPTNIAHYTGFLFIGILAWTWFASALTQATVAIVDNGELIRYPGFPEMILPVVAVTSHLIHFVVALPIVVLVMLVTGVPMTGAVLALPLVILLQFILLLSLAYLVATLHVWFRDTQYLLGITLLLGFFLTPIFYSIATIPEQYRPVFQLNPMLHLITAYRTILLEGKLPTSPALLVVGAVSLALLLLGYRVLVHTSKRFVEEI